MRVEIDPGRLEERSTTDGRMRRTAHGEFVGPRGELASYAIGWEQDADPHAGWITIGIGAGDPGGGTFHARVFDDDGNHAFSLADDRWADVPQGGPHLTAARARAHEDLRFVWAVADTVMDRDPRAWWMRHWLFGTLAIATPQVVDGAEPVLVVVRDKGGHGGPEWSMSGSTAASDPLGAARVLHLSHVLDSDPTVAGALGVRPGRAVHRHRVDEPWCAGDPGRRSGLRSVVGRLTGRR